MKIQYQSDMSELVVRVEHGDLRGVETENVTGGSYITFNGIPYASPPIDELRFKDPQPPQPWTKVRDASKEGSKSAQFDVFTQKIVGDEDCLYLNVATRSLTESRPVMVWFHGGIFVLGDGGHDLYSPDYLMRSEIVYVGINYRLGVLGFLNVDHEAAPGNMGLKDQVAALKWVKRNIAKFGGDPNNITIFGESAGSASVHYHLLSPLSKGLFHKAIMQSGVALNPWASVSDTVDMARRYVAALGKEITDPNKIVEYLRTIPVHRLISVQESLLPLEDRANLIFPFGPTVDDKSIDPFMPRPAHELVAKGFEVPVIIGYTSDEGIYFLSGIQDEAYKRLDANFEIMVRRRLAAKVPSKVPEIIAEIRKFYFGNEPITKDTIDKYIQCYGDLQFNIDIHNVVEIQRRKKSPTYFFRFSYDSPNSFAKTLFQIHAKGAMHTEDLQYLFFTKQFRAFVKMEPGSTDEIVRDRLVRMWTDFAETGNPTPTTDDLITEKWEPVTEKSKNYLEINAELSTGVNPNEDMWKMGKRIYAMADGQ